MEWTDVCRGYNAEHGYNWRRQQHAEDVRRTRIIREWPGGFAVIDPIPEH